MQPDTTVNRTPRILLLAAMAFLVTACGGGGGGSSAPATQGIGGGGVKGPLANAVVTAYAFDATAADFQGAVIDAGTTDATAKITGLALTLPLAPPYILEFTTVGGTIDITTGVAPVITTMRTVLTQALLDNGEDVYATPLTTMATDLAIANAGIAAFGGDDVAPVTSAEFVAALPIAASQVASTLGFGIDSTIDIFDTPPLVDDTTDTTEEQTNVAAYRAAVEAVTAVVYEMDQQSSGTTPDSVLSEITSDLANDGVIDGVTEAGTSTVLTTATLEVLEQDPATLPIPNSDDGAGNPILVGDVEQVLIDETATTGTTTDTAELDPTTGSIDTVVEPAETNPDIDGDGTLNADDAFPTDAAEDTDTDGDGTGNNADADDDNDGVADGSDAFPLDATEHVDTDSDGTGNNADTDDDDDGTPDASDDFPLDDTKQNATDVDNDGWPTGQDLNDADDQIPGTGTPFIDTDGDSLADSGGAADDADDDNDGVDDVNDCAPLDASKNVDTDGDTMCDDVDTDDDGDGTADTADAFPLDNTETTDTDGDGVGNNTDSDDDNDGVSDTQEGTDGTDPLLRDTDSDGYFDGSDAFPLDGNEHVDTDSDGTGNNADADDDADGVDDSVEITDGTKPLVADTDDDNLSDGAEKTGGTNPLLADTDADNTDDDTDNCPIVANADQLDTDSDTDGDACDTDDDNDNVSDTDEATAGTDPLDADTDGDTVNDDTDAFPLDATESADTDSDTVGDNADNCPAVSNVSQLNTDGDTFGNACDTDVDGDGILDDGDASGAAGDNFCAAGASTSCDDNCPLIVNASQADADGNGIGDACDFDDDGDGFSNTLDNCPTVANPNQTNSDTDADGDACDTDDDNDNVSDVDEATAGTDPLDPDTDGDTVNDDVDVFPLDGTESADADSDTVGDNGDNCPADANTDQLNTDGDANGNVCDTDDDNDGVEDGSDAFPLDNTESVDTDGDGTGNNADTDDDNDGVSDTDEAAQGSNPLVVDTDGDTVNDDTDNCPTVSNASQTDTSGNGIGDACEQTGATGVWKTTATVTGLTDEITNGCLDSDPVSTVNDFYMTMTQSGTAITAKTAWGDSLTGTIDNGTGAFTLSGVSTYTDPFSGDVSTDTISVAGNTTSATTWTGTVTLTEAFQPFGGSSTDQCTETDSLASTFVYKHVAGENYDGVYGLELADDEGRSSFAVEFEITGSTMALRLPFNNPNETFTNTSFDPNTGFFSFDIVGVEDYDDGVGSEEWRDKLTGILVRAPDEATLPTVFLNIDGYWAEYDAFGGSTGGGAMTANGQDEDGGYGKRQSSTGFTRSSFFRNSSTGDKVQGIFMGMSHPPLKRATATSELYVEVLDGATRLCASEYSKRYTNADYKPAADMSIEAFQSQFYSFVTCDTSGGDGTHTVTDGMDYTVRIMDTGADGVIGGADVDTEVTGSSMTVTAGVNTDFFTALPSANSAGLNGAIPSQTMVQGVKSGVIQLYGFFNVNEDMVLDWDGLAGAEKYSIQLKEFGDIGQTRFNMTAAGTATESITLPAGTLEDWDPTLIRIRARKDEAVTGDRALSSSKWLMVNPGVSGLFNVELGGVMGQELDTFQLYMEGDMGDGTNGWVNRCQSTSQNWTCNSGTINYTSNTVSLNMTDLTGSYGTVTVDLTFGDSGAGQVTSISPGVTVVPSETSVRLVNPELLVRTLKPSGGAGQQTFATLVNTFGGADGFDKAVFKREDNLNITYNSGAADSGATSKVSWCETGICGTDKLFDTVAGAFQQRPTDDGVAQGVGHFISDRAFSDWGIGSGGATNSVLDATTYKSVWTMSTDSTLKFVFKKAYAAADASVLVTPIHNQVTVELPTPVTAGTGVGDSANPIDVVSQPAFGLTWTGAVPTDGKWQIRITYLVSASGFVPPGGEVRSEWMDATHADLIDNGGTWTWDNGEGISLVSGDTVSVQIRALDVDNTMLGAQRAGTVDDRVYLTIP